ncbi:hypothetical protein FOHLNKBM_6166 [Methylobacterium longum]|nr:hypothetical protein FOHLNKBM_6166 [Methylobacterium longum]
MIKWNSRVVSSVSAHGVPMLAQAATLWFGMKANRLRDTMYLRTKKAPGNAAGFFRTF